MGGGTESGLEALSLDADEVAVLGTSGPVDPPALAAPGERYAMTDELGRGAMGVVVQAWDRDLQRDVAVKRLLPGLMDSPLARARFIREARLGALDHPNIVTVHELGQDAEGTPFLVMRRLAGRTMRDVLDLRSRGAPEQARVWGRNRLLRAFVQLCGAVSYAHSQRVLHRDIKPENVVVGDFGEVQLLDWGVAARFEELLDPDFEREQVRGTPGYIAPEMLVGSARALPERADVYALGALLYELLTGSRPWADFDASDVLHKTVHEDPQPPSRRAPWASIPPELEEVCLAALCRDPHERVASAEVLARRVEGALEGEREAQRLQSEADGKVLEADAWLQRHTHLRERVEQADRAAEDHRAALAPWSRVEQKRRAWQAEDHAGALRLDLDDAFDSAHRTLLAAIERVPSHEGARRRLARLWLTRLQGDEARNDSRSARRSRAQVQLWDNGALAHELAPGGRLTVRSDPPGAAIHCAALTDVDRMLLPGALQDLGTAPLRSRSLAEGSHLLMLEAPGRLPTRLPVLVRRGREEHLDVWLPPWDRLPPGMVYVPAGAALLGGARGRGGYGVASARREAQVDGFAIAVFPVTFGEYLEFLESLRGEDPTAAEARLPRLPGRGPLVREEGGRWVPDVGELREADAADAGWSLPVVGVSWFDAAAWCAWRSEQFGLPIRLAHEDEWEKAGRGVDGRMFPWGPTYEPGFASHADGSSRGGRLSAVGRSGMDESVYGVRDLQGGVAEWCQGWFDEAVGLRPLRGSHWRTDGRRTLAARMGRPPDGRWDMVGFRAAATLSP